MNKTPIECKLCNNTYTVAGLRSHIKSKHPEYSTEKYVKEFGEFRTKQLKELALKKKSNFKCAICNNKMVSNKQLMHHLKKHNIVWQDYIVKYIYKGKHPLCSCGCGQKVRLLRHGKNDKGEVTYAREMLSGHNNNPPGYRVCTLEQKQKMRLAHIKRMKEGKTPFHYKGPSKGEQSLYSFIEQNYKRSIVQGDKKLLSGLELDIVLPDLNICFEFNGCYFHSDLHKDRKYHLKKTEETQELGYRLIHIWECDWYAKREIVESIVLNILKKTPNIYYARNCYIQEVSTGEKSIFYRKNHLQGTAVGKVHLGLYDKKSKGLLSIMSFSSLRRSVGMNSKEGSYELVRFCNSLNTGVVGGASKLFRHFIKHYDPKHIISYANRDWSDGSLYRILGFKFNGYTKPGYFYTKSRHRFSRHLFQKHKLIKKGYDPEKSEYQIMLDRGYLRTWDCGNLKYEWSKEKVNLLNNL